jgi:hypothetical protein
LIFFLEFDAPLSKAPSAAASLPICTASHSVYCTLKSLFIGGLFNSAVSISRHTASNGVIQNNELAGMWKETTIMHLEVPLRYLRVGTEENCKKLDTVVISGFCHDADQICVLLGCYTASNCNPLPTFRDKVSVPSSRVKKSKKKTFRDSVSVPPSRVKKSTS